jgi:uncharacterized protein
MALSLYDCTVASFIQTLTGVSGVMARGLKHCEAKGIDPSDVVMTRMVEDMLPFHFQITSVAHHSVGAIKAARTGTFDANEPGGRHNYAGLQNVVADALQSLQGETPDSINALADKDVMFVLGETKIPFTAQNFLLSFSLPNFYFHATTAYDILRSKGAPLGKRHFLGPMRIKA